eukprot:scaffold99131_cov25-Tisochrysis_lutea.AAC.1
MATDPPDRPTFAALQRESSMAVTGRRSHRPFMPPHSDRTRPISAAHLSPAHAAWPPAPHHTTFSPNLRSR